MNKKPFIITIITTILLTAGIAGWQVKTYSQEESGESRFAADCTGREDGGTDYCCIAYRTAMENMEIAWSDNLEGLKDQERPASELINDGIENYRTYKCWLQYVCRAVQYSGHYSPYGEGALENKLTSKHIGSIPGCQDPEDLGLSDTWSTFVDFMEKDWDFLKDTLVGTGDTKMEINMDLPESWFVKNSIGFIPQCMTDITDLNHQPDLSEAERNYNQCMELVDQKFGCEDPENCESPEIALVQLESALKEAHADQKTRALENKLSDIINKMLVMETNVEYMKTKLQAIDQRYPCYPSKCY